MKIKVIYEPEDMKTGWLRAHLRVRAKRNWHEYEEKTFDMAAPEEKEWIVNNPIIFFDDELVRERDVIWKTLEVLNLELLPKAKWK